MPMPEILVTRQIRQRMSTFPDLMKVRPDNRLRDRIDVRPMPVRLVVLVDQAGTNAFAEFRVTAAVQAHGVFHLEDLGQ